MFDWVKIDKLSQCSIIENMVILIKKYFNCYTGGWRVGGRGEILAPTKMMTLFAQMILVAHAAHGISEKIFNWEIFFPIEYV